MLRDPGAQEYAANQTREEARHVTGFAMYIKARWGKPLPVGPALGTLLSEMVLSPYVWKKLVGMQMLVEGLAMGAFATNYQYTNDPLLKRLCQLVMTDEAFHHKFGKIWADRTIPHLSQPERDLIEDWAAQVFQGLLFNLGSPEQKKPIYAEFGIDWEWAQSAFREAFTDARVRERLKDRIHGLGRHVTNRLHDFSVVSSAGPIFFFTRPRGGSIPIGLHHPASRICLAAGSSSIRSTPPEARW